MRDDLMSEQQRPDVLTKVTVPEMFAALRSAWRDAFREGPKRESLLVLLSQWALETGRGKSMHCFNLGNVKHVPGDGRDFTYFRCNEILNGKEVWFDPPNPASCFRAYASLDEGAADYLALLHRRFASAWPAVVAGAPGDFARALYDARYYTADPRLYTRTLVSLFDEFSRTIPPDPDPAAGLAEQASSAIQIASLTLPREPEDEPEPPPDAA